MTTFGGIEFIVVDAQEQRRTPIVGHYIAPRIKQWTRTKRLGRKCSRRKWKSMNRRQYVWHPIYEEPSDVIQLNGRFVVTPRQKQALIEEMDRRNRTSQRRPEGMP